MAASLIREHQRIGQIITVELSYKQLRALTVSLYLERHGKDDDDYATLRKLLVRARQVEEQRNRIAPSVWGAAGPDGKVFRLKATAKEGSGFRHSAEELSEADLAAVAKEIREVAEGLQRFHFRLIESGKAINNPVDKLW